MNKRIFKKMVMSATVLVLNVNAVSLASTQKVTTPCREGKCKDNKADLKSNDFKKDPGQDSKPILDSATSAQKVAVPCCEGECTDAKGVLKGTQDEFIKDPEPYLKSALDSARPGWEFVRKSFTRAKIDANANLEKLGFNHLSESDDKSEYYLKYINDFLNSDYDFKGIEIDDVTIRKNDKRSEDIQRNLAVFNVARKFDLVVASMRHFNNVTNYKNNPKLMKEIRESLRIFGDNLIDVDSMNDGHCSMLWESFILSYLNGVFNFYDNFVNIEKYSMYDCKGILQFEFDIANKATSLCEDFKPLNTAIKFMYDYANDVLDGKLPDLSEEIKTSDVYLKT